MAQNCDYTLLVNSYTENLVQGLIPQRILPFDCYEKRKIDSEVKTWIEDGGIDFAVVTGDAGFGKTNLLCTLAIELIKKGTFTVFFVKSENLIDDFFDENILTSLDLRNNNLSLGEVLETISESEKKIIFLLDTLDVIATDKGIARLDQFLTTFGRYCPIVIGASRPIEYGKIKDLAKRTFELKPFSDDEVESLFNKYKTHYKMEGVQLRQPIIDVCRNPLHMRMLFEVYQPDEIPEDINTQKLYDQYWDKKVKRIRRGALSHLNEGEKNLAAEIKERLASKIALEMYNSGKVTLEKSEVDGLKYGFSEAHQNASISDSDDVKIHQEIRTITTNQSIIVQDAYRDLLTEGVLREQNKKIEFFHQTFFEYSAARSIIEEDEGPRQRLLEDLLSDITLLENRPIIEQLILFAKRCEEKKNRL